MRWKNGEWKDVKSGHFLLSSEWAIFPVLSQNWEKRRFQSTIVTPLTTSCIFLQGKGFWPCSQGCMTEDSNLVGLLTSCSSNWLTSCVIRAGLLWLEIPQSLSQQRLLEDVILAKVLQMVFSKVFFFWFVFYLKKFLAVPQGLWDLSSPTSDRTLASCVVSCESGILRVHFLLIKIISIGTYLITSSSEITVSIFCWGSASKASKPRTAPSLNSTKGSVPCIECILYTSADN